MTAPLNPASLIPTDACLRLWRHVEANNNADLAAFQPLHIAGRRLGSVRPDKAQAAGLEPAGQGAWQLPGDPRDPAGVTAALDAAAERLLQAGVLPRLKGERYAVTPAWGQPHLGSADRAAVPVLGLPAYGLHIHGFTRRGPRPQDIALWIGLRAQDRDVAPGQLDTTVGGGQPAELTLLQNLAKEGREEAGLPPGLVAEARATGAIAYTRHDKQGLRVDTLFSFDLELPADFQPAPQDDEVECFRLLPVLEVLDILLATDRFKVNCALIVTDFLLRHGVLTPDLPGYAALCRGMHGRHPHDAGLLP